MDGRINDSYQRGWVWNKVRSKGADAVSSRFEHISLLLLLLLLLLLFLLLLLILLLLLLL